MKRNLKILFWFVVIVICVGLFALFAPAISLEMWHLTHSTDQKVYDRELRVPKSFVLIRSKGRAKMIQIRPTFSFSKGWYDFNEVVMTPKSHPVDIQEWQKRAVNRSIEAGFGMVSAFNAAMGETPAICIQHRQPDPDISEVVFCTATDGSTAEYYGKESGIQDFKQILQSFKKQTRPSAPSQNRSNQSG